MEGISYLELDAWRRESVEEIREIRQQIYLEKIPHSYLDSLRQGNQTQ